MTVPPTSAPETPSARRLLRSTLIALAVAAAILVTIVMPAEYGVDPTGIGRMLGLTQMGEIKMQLAREEAGHQGDSVAAAPGGAQASAPGSSASPAAPATGSGAGRSDSVSVVLAPAQGHEIKLVMRKDARVNYAWSTMGGVVNYDTHGDNPTTRYHGYTKGTSVRADSGVLTSAFDGAHGWFWRNRTSDTVVVTLRTRGDYSELKHVP